MLIVRDKKILSKGEKSADQNLRQSTFRRNITRKGKFENINTTVKLNGKKDKGRQRKMEEEPAMGPLVYLPIFDPTPVKNYLAHLLSQMTNFFFLFLMGPPTTAPQHCRVCGGGSYITKQDESCGQMYEI